MGGYGVTSEELEKIKGMWSKGIRPAVIARKLDRSAGFVTRYGKAIESGEIKVSEGDRTAPLPAAQQEEPKMSNGTKEEIMRIIIRSGLSTEEKVKVLGALV